MSLSAEEGRVQREIQSWLADEQQLTELGRRCVDAMLGQRVLPVDARMGLVDRWTLRRLLVNDWLRDT